MPKSNPYLDFLKNMRPSQYLMIAGTGFCLLGAVGTVAGYSVVDGLERMVFGTGVLLILVGTYLSFVRAKMENRAKREYERAPYGRSKRD
jgi:hypothetical protein